MAVVPLSLRPWPSGTPLLSGPSGQLCVFAHVSDFLELSAPTGLNLGLPAALNSAHVTSGLSHVPSHQPAGDAGRGQDTPTPSEISAALSWSPDTSVSEDIGDSQEPALSTSSPGSPGREVWSTLRACALLRDGGQGMRSGLSAQYLQAAG